MYMRDSFWCYPQQKDIDGTCTWCKVVTKVTKFKTSDATTITLCKDCEWAGRKISTGGFCVQRFAVELVVQHRLRVLAKNADEDKTS